MDLRKTKKLENSVTQPLELRCSNCGKLLARSDKQNIAYHIKCVRCGKLNPLFKGVKDQVVITNPDGVIIYANSVLETVTGYSLAEVLGKTPAIWGGQMPREFYEKMWHTIKVEKQPISVIVTNKKKDGALYKAELRISPVFGTGRRIKMFVGIESVVK